MATERANVALLGEDVERVDEDVPGARRIDYSVDEPAFGRTVGILEGRAVLRHQAGVAASLVQDRDRARRAHHRDLRARPRDAEVVADAARVLDRAVAITPKDAALRLARAEIELDWHADPRPLISTIQAILTEDSPEAENIAEFWLLVSQCQRDVDGAQRALDALPNDGCHAEPIPFPKTWCQGVVAQMRGDSTAARTAFAAVHNEAEKLVREQPAYAEAFCVLAMADAALGQREDAIREGRRAVELLPVTKDSITGSLLLEFLALTYAWTGEKDLALQQLAVAASIPSELSYGQLRLHPYWDPLRGDPRFEQIVVSLAPK